LCLKDGKPTYTYNWLECTGVPWPPDRLCPLEGDHPLRVHL
jgi:hypothetical protein